MTQVDRDSATTTPPSPPPGLQEAIDAAQAAQAAAEVAQVAAEAAAAAASIDPSVYAIKGKNKFTDAQDFANAVNVASASTVNLNAMQSNTGTLTGTTTITAWALSDGAFRRLRCPAGIQLTFNATTNNLNTGGTNYTTQAGDELHITAFGTIIDVQIIPASGLPVTSPAVLNATNDPIFASTSSTQPTSAQWVNGRLASLPFTKSYASAEQTITIGGLLTLAHGMGVVPKLIIAFLKCQTAENGYSIGDTFPINVNLTDLGRGIVIISNTTNITVRYSSSGFIGLNKTTGAPVAFTDANWRLIINAYA